MHIPKSLANPWLPKVWRVVARIQECVDMVTLEIAPREGLPAAIEPGQFHMMYRFGIGEIPISLSSISEKSVSHTVRSVGAVSNALARAAVGSEIGIRGPFGSYWDLKGAEGYDLIIVAGGVGIAPLKPLIESITQKRQAFGKVYVLYGARDPRHVLFESSAALWRQSLTFLRTVDTIASQTWREHVGAVSVLFPRIRINPERSRAFVCGPEVMMRYVINQLIEFQIKSSEIFLSLERNMKCAIGFCGHCQLGGYFLCKDGPVFSYPQVEDLLKVKEL